MADLVGKTLPFSRYSGALRGHTDPTFDLINLFPAQAVTDFKIRPVFIQGPVGRIGYAFLGDISTLLRLFRIPDAFVTAGGGLQSTEAKAEFGQLVLFQEIQELMHSFIGMQIDCRVDYRVMSDSQAAFNNTSAFKTFTHTDTLERITIELLFATQPGGGIVPDRVLQGYGIFMDVAVPILPENTTHFEYNDDSMFGNEQYFLSVGNGDVLIALDSRSDDWATKNRYIAQLPDNDTGQFVVESYSMRARQDFVTQAQWGRRTIQSASGKSLATNPNPLDSARDSLVWTNISQQISVDAYQPYNESPYEGMFNLEGVVTGYDFSESPKASIFDVAGEDYRLIAATNLDNKRWSVVLSRTTKPDHNITDTMGY